MRYPRQTACGPRAYVSHNNFSSSTIRPRSTCTIRQGNFRLKFVQFSLSTSSAQKDREASRADYKNENRRKFSGLIVRSRGVYNLVFGTTETGTSHGMRRDTTPPLLLCVKLKRVSMNVGVENYIIPFRCTTSPLPLYPPEALQVVRPISTDLTPHPRQSQLTRINTFQTAFKTRSTRRKNSGARSPTTSYHVRA